MKTPKEIAEQICTEMALWVDQQSEISQDNMFELLETKIIEAIRQDRLFREQERGEVSDEQE